MRGPRLAAQSTHWVRHARAGAGQACEVVGVAAPWPQRFGAVRGTVQGDGVEANGANGRWGGDMCGPGDGGRGR